MKYNFQEIKLKETVSLKCCKCGKRMSKVVSDYQTVNPFNKKPNGEMKTSTEIYAELWQSINGEIDKLKSNPIACKACKENP